MYFFTHNVQLFEQYRISKQVPVHHHKSFLNTHTFDLPLHPLLLLYNAVLSCFLIFYLGSGKLYGLALNLASTHQTENPRGFSEEGDNKQLLIAIVGSRF